MSRDSTRVKLGATYVGLRWAFQVHHSFSLLSRALEYVPKGEKEKAEKVDDLAERPAFGQAFYIT